MLILIIMMITIILTIILIIIIMIIIMIIGGLEMMFLGRETLYTQRSTEVSLGRSALSVCPCGDPWGTPLN